jgi:lycopene beta-cyclase
VSAGAWDIVIVGGGLAGLSLAAALASQPRLRWKVLVLEARAQYRRDRTWSFWVDTPLPYAHLARRTWNAWRVRGDSVECIARGPAYASLDGDVFYREARSRIDGSCCVELRLGTPVSSISPGLRPAVQLSDGEALRAHLVVDARPLPSSSAQFYQSFAGGEFECDDDCFDPDLVDLMDLQPASSGAHFFYVLPYSARRALVQATWIDRSVPSLQRRGLLESYMARRWPDARLRADYLEDGVLPLATAAAPQPCRGVLPVGQRAGTLRASTGYAFAETVLDTWRLAGEMAACHAPAELHDLQPFRRPRTDLWMDRIFLQALGLQPDLGRRLLLSLFQRCPPPALVRFLSGRAGTADRLDVVRSLPAWPMLRAAWQDGP